MGGEDRHDESRRDEDRSHPGLAGGGGRPADRRGARHGADAVRTDDSAPGGGQGGGSVRAEPEDAAAGWNDTWAGRVSPEEQARARALLGLALEGGSGAADAAKEWAEANRRTRPRPAAGRGAGGAGGAGPEGAEPGDALGDAGTDTGVDGAGPRTRRSRGTSTRRPGKRTGGFAGSGRGEAYSDAGNDDGAFGEPAVDGAVRPGGRRRGRRGRDDTGRDDAGEPGGRRERRIGPAQIDPDEDPEAQARAICLRQLTGQARTRAQLADAMKRRGVPDDVAEHVLGRFTEVKLIDDAAFAAAWVDTRHLGRGLARRALAQELRQRGVDSELVSEAVERLDPEQELATARALVERRIPSTRRLDRKVRMRRLAGMLARKGYGEGLALRVVRDALDADEAWQREAEDDDGWAYEPFGADDTPPEPED